MKSYICGYAKKIYDFHEDGKVILVEENFKPSMEHETLTMRSTISTGLKQHVLLKGTLFASCGGLLFLCGGLFLPVSVLAVWGPLFFIAGGFLIAYGLLPYRQLTRKEMVPDKLVVVENKHIDYIVKEKLMLKVPLSIISRAGFIEHPHEYGIGIWLKNPSKEKIIVCQPAYKVKNYLPLQGREGCDLFFPYFSNRSFKELEAVLNDS